MTATIPSEETMQALVGTRLAGGTYEIAHWENFLFTDACATDQLPDGLAHPAHLFHVAINGASTTIQELFDRAHSLPGDRVSIDFYDWTMHRPLREDERYTITGTITEHTRSEDRRGLRDSVTYVFELVHDDGGAVAEVAFRWHYYRRTQGAAP